MDKKNSIINVPGLSDKKYLLLVTAIVFSLIFSCNRSDNESDAFGNFESDEIIVSSQVQGELLSFDIEEGKHVEAGKLAGIVDTTALILQKSQLLAQLKVISAKRDNIRSQIDVQEEQLKNLVREAKRLEKLVEGNAATQQQLDDMTGKVDVANSQLNSIKTQFESLNAENKVLDSQINQIDNQLDNCRVINPVTGTVLEKYVYAHELVSPGKSLYKIADLSTMQLKVYISGGLLPRVNIGDKVEVIFDKNQDEVQTLPGTVSWISSEVEFTPKTIQTREERVNMVYGVKIRVKNDGRIKIGMPGEVKFVNKETEQ